MWLGLNTMSKCLGRDISVRQHSKSEHWVPCQTTGDMTESLLKATLSPNQTNKNLVWDVCKQCRPRSDAANRGVWSGSTLFAKITVIYRLNETILNPRSGPFFKPTLQGNRPISAVSALIQGRLRLWLCCLLSFISWLFWKKVFSKRKEFAPFRAVPCSGGRSKLQSNLSTSNFDGSFTMAKSVIF